MCGNSPNASLFILVGASYFYIKNIAGIIRTQSPSILLLLINITNMTLHIFLDFILCRILD
jgi:uncharacterized membrane protein